MKTESIALILAAVAALLIALTLNPASGGLKTASVPPAASEKSVEEIPVQHVGTAENQPL